VVTWAEHAKSKDSSTQKSKDNEEPAPILQRERMKEMRKELSATRSHEKRRKYDRCPPDLLAKSDKFTRRQPGRTDQANAARYHGFLDSS
jgi:bisphosphoglycerate-dependent phosphoglycerate mutase